MLDNLLNMHRARLAALAEAWLHMGATSFSIWSDQRLLAAWPTGSQPGPPAVSATINIAGAPIGALHLTGSVGMAAKQLLEADAGLLAELVGSEGELETMTGELIELQDQLLALYDLTQSTRSHLHVKDMLQAVVREASRLVKTQAAFAYLEQSTGGHLWAQHPAPGIDEHALLELINKSDGDHTGLLLNNTSGTALPVGVTNIVLLPIRIRGSAIAGIGLINKLGGDFTSPDLKLIRAICDQAGAQVENIMLYQETIEQAKLKTELDLAAQIQQRLLPQHLPQVAGLDIVAGSRAALQVGGDFYDFITPANGPTTFAVGDVAGKGISASLLMSITHTVLRNAARFMAIPSPAGVISRVNSDLYDDLTEVGMFVTAFVGHVDTEQHELVFANAGHSPVVFCPKGGPARLLMADGSPMGVLPDSYAVDQRLPFRCDDLLVIATDGFSEASSPDGDLYGYERLLELIEKLAPETANDVVQGLFDAVVRFGEGQPQDDDLTLVVVKAVPERVL